MLLDPSEIAPRSGEAPERTSYGKQVALSGISRRVKDDKKLRQRKAILCHAW